MAEEEKVQRKVRSQYVRKTAEPVSTPENLANINAEAYKKPDKTETINQRIITADGRGKTKTFETRTYPNGVVKQRLVKVVKHK